jgi:type III pantothenate kinase
MCASCPQSAAESRRYSSMLLAIDIGNSSIKFGVFDRDQLTSKFFIPAKRDYSAAEIVEHVGDRLPALIEAAIVSSVVTEIDGAMAEYISRHLHIEPRFIATTNDFNLKFGFALDTVGTDRLVNSFAAVEKYGAPCIVVSFGTATTIDVINRDREHLGGLITPGMDVTVKALALAASKLPEVLLTKPERIIASTTEKAIQSGIVYGHIAMIEGLLKRVIAELQSVPGTVMTGAFAVVPKSPLATVSGSDSGIKVVATGGFADLVAPEIDLIDIVDNDLTLEGLQMLFQKSAH